jgi:lipid-binding SYLF domain-containing protein
MIRFNKRLTLGAALALTVGLLASARISYAGDTTDLVAAAQHTVALYKKADPGMKFFFDHAAGYVVFPGIAKAGLGIGGAHGSGVVFESGTPVGKATVSQVSVGAQIGAQDFSEVIFFETPRALADFKQGKAAFSAQVSAVALKTGASAAAKYKDGVAVFTATKEGLMAEASVGGQKFGFDAFPL